MLKVPIQGFLCSVLGPKDTTRRVVDVREYAG